MSQQCGTNATLPLYWNFTGTGCRSVCTGIDRLYACVCTGVNEVAEFLYVPQWKTIIHFNTQDRQKTEIFSQAVFQYSERTKATTETNNTSKESSKSQLLGAKKTKGWLYHRDAKPTCRKKHICSNENGRCSVKRSPIVRPDRNPCRLELV